MQNIPEFRWCQAFCGSGQVHEGKGTFSDSKFSSVSYSLIFLMISFIRSDFYL